MAIAQQQTSPSGDVCFLSSCNLQTDFINTNIDNLLPTYFMSSLIIAIQIIIIWQFWTLVERVSDKNSMEWIDHFQEKTKVSDAVAWELFQGLATSFPEMSTMFVSVVFFALNPVVWLAANVGSGVFQFMPVIAIPALVSKKPLHVDKYEVIRTVLFYFSTLVLLGLVILDGKIQLMELIGIVAYWAIFMYRTITQRPHIRTKKWRKKQPIRDHHLPDSFEKKQGLFARISRYLPTKLAKLIPAPDHKRGYIGKIPLGFILSLLLVGISVYILVGVVEDLWTKFGISIAFLSLTILATITSLPELATNIPLAKKGKGDQIIGNAVGSNSIDIAISTCLMTLIAALVTNTSVFVIQDKAAILWAIALLALISLLFLGLLRASKWKLGKRQGVILLVAYVAYVGFNYFNFQ